MERKILTSTMNTRDLGGHPIASGGRTCFHRFVRSDLPATLTEAEVSLLLGRGIATVVDLRSEEEANERPSFFCGRRDFDCRHYPIAGGGTVPLTEEEIPASYQRMLGDTSVLYHIMKTFADAEGGVLFHCSAGKDRTGVVASLLLSLAGVPLPEIVADYQVSYANISPMIRRIRAHDPALPRWIGQSKPAYLLKFLSAFEREYGTVDRYLAHIGLTAAEIGKLKAKLTTP